MGRGRRKYVRCWSGFLLDWPREVAIEASRTGGDVLSCAAGRDGRCVWEFNGLDSVLGL